MLLRHQPTDDAKKPEDCNPRALASVRNVSLENANYLLRRRNLDVRKASVMRNVEGSGTFVTFEVTGDP